MVQWQRHIFPILRRIHKGVDHANHSASNLVISRLGSSFSQEGVHNNFALYLKAYLSLFTASAEAFVGMGYFKKRVSYHGKGKVGLKVRPECRLTVVVREITPEEEAEIARLRVHNFKKLTKREKQLVPHQLIETIPVWGRKSKSSGQNLSAAAALALLICKFLWFS